MQSNLVRTRLLECAVEAVARDGPEKVSASRIALTAGIQEQHAKSCFPDGRALLEETFVFLHRQLLDQALEHSQVMGMPKMIFPQRCRCYFLKIWHFLMTNPTLCLAYAQFYYCPDFESYCGRDYEAELAPLVERMAPLFRRDADVRQLLAQMFRLMLDFATQVHTGGLRYDSQCSERAFQQVYLFAREYFRNDP